MTKAPLNFQELMDSLSPDEALELTEVAFAVTLGNLTKEEEERLALLCRKWAPTIADTAERRLRAALKRSKRQKSESITAGFALLLKPDISGFARLLKKSDGKGRP